MAAMVMVPPDGRVDLSKKQIPVFQQSAPYDSDYCYTLARIDGKRWQEKLQSLPNEFWEDKNQVGNVKLVRASHDAWGIQKIIFTFCDDFLTTVMDLPYSQDPEWKSLLNEVYSAIGIDESRVVRSLLARMPTGVNIPPHHDTGVWVKQTHRCHLAIETNELVEFWVGPVETELKQYFYEPGRIIELNNQAKHAVYNKMTSGYRTHLIFDYVDPSFNMPPRLLLNPGEIVYQTRRSIDLYRNVKDYDVYMHTPRFIVIGAQKSGTTSMYEYLNQHPLVSRSKRRETHYFDWRFNHKLSPEDVTAHRKYYLNFYEQELLQRHPSIVTGESTPSYLLHFNIVLPRMRQIVPWTKLIVMMRNPVDRAYSQFQMIQDSEGTPEQLAVRGQSSFVGKSFADAVEEEIAQLNRGGLSTEMTVDAFAQSFLQDLPMNHGGHSLLLRGLYCFQIEAYLQSWPKEQLKLMSIKDIQGSKADVVATMNSVFSYVGLPAIDDLDIEPRNTRKYDPLDSETRSRLEDFFRPYNERLFATLGYEMHW